MPYENRPPPSPFGHNPEYDNCECEQCKLTAKIIQYMMWYMEPTDRVLRPAEPRD